MMHKREEAKKTRNNPKAGQAVVELAVFGTLILVALATLLIYGQRFELQQGVKMEAFRLALEKAYKRNSSVSYTLKKDVRFFNLQGGYGQGQASTVGATASVMWQKGVAGLQGSTNQQNFAYHQVNDALVGTAGISGDSDIFLPRYEKLNIGYDGTKSEIMVPVSVWNEERTKEEEYNATVIKDEKPSAGTRGVITNIRTSDLKDKVSNTLYTRFDKSVSNPNGDPDERNPLPVYDYGTPTYANQQQGAYYNPETNRIEYSKDKVGTNIHREKNWVTTFDK